MTTLDDFLADRGSNYEAQTFAARFPVEQPGSKGAWSARADYVRSWDARVDEHAPQGRIVLEPQGYLRIELEDFQGWKPFIAVGGMQAGRNLQWSIAYSYDGTTVVTSGQAQWDPSMTLYEGIGATSDGTLAGAGLSSSITLAALDGQEMTIDYAFVGWLQLP